MTKPFRSLLRIIRSCPRAMRRVLRRWNVWRRTERVVGVGGKWSHFALDKKVALGTAGGQGTVYGLAEHPRLVYKEYHHPIQGAERSFELLLGRGEAVRAAAPEHVEFAWPIAMVPTEAGVAAYVMPRISDEFSVKIRLPNGRTQIKQATLDHAIPRLGHFQVVTPVTTEERLQIAVLVGEALMAMHRHDVVYRDLSFKNIFFAREPMRVAFMDIDSARVLEHPTIPEKDGVDTPDWSDPHASSAEPVGFDLDRFKYALLVYRLLVVHGTNAPWPAQDVEFRLTQLDGVPRGNWGRVEELFRRAIRSPGARPAIGEWLDVLSA